MSQFLKPTLVTLTAPSASGKSYLLNALTDRGIFNRIVSTTTRSQREGEREGVDYYFISQAHSLDLEDRSQFFELITFNGVRYGVTNDEMKGKMAQPTAPIVVLEPQGLGIYEKECRKHGWDVFKIYVHVTESKRLDRLLTRAITDCTAALDSVVVNPNSKFASTFQNVAYDNAVNKISKAITEHHKRLVGLEDERLWSNTTSWDVIVPGDDLEKAIGMIKDGIAWRNRKIEDGLYS